MIWFKNIKTGLKWEIDNETTKVVLGKKELKYQSLINRLNNDTDFVVIDLEEEARIEAEKKELAALRAEKAKAKAKVKKAEDKK